MSAFPSLAWFEAARAKLNADPSYRKLGSADTRFAVKQGDALIAVQLEAFECAKVEPTNEDDLRELDFTIEMNAGQWRAYLDGLRGIGRTESLSTLDLESQVIKGNARGRLQMPRYLLSIEKFFAAGANA